MRINSIGHAVLYHASWATTVWGWVSGHHEYGVAVSLAYFALTVWSVRNLSPALPFIIVSSAGWGIETLNTVLGIFAYSPAPLAPYWIAPLWGAFYLFFHYGMTWLRHFWIAAVLGILFGPCAYLAAASWASVHLSIIQWTGLAIEWGIVFPVLMYLRNYLISQTISRGPAVK